MGDAFTWGVGFGGHETGNYLGYGTANDGMHRALASSGMRETPDADVVVHFCFPLLYEPKPGKRNVLFTMYENPTDLAGLKRIFKPALDSADLVVVPSRFCADMMRPHTDTPIVVCPLGIDPEAFEYRERVWDKRAPFVWLYCGALNRRKFTILDELWQTLNAPGGDASLRGRMMLYVKTTGMDLDEPSVQDMLRDVVIFRPPEGEVAVCAEDSVIIDNRKLPHDRLAEVYWQAHGAVFLHCGEGWGLTGHEAMATGLPLVVSDYAGTREFADASTAFPVEMKQTRIETTDKNGAADFYDGPWPVAESAAFQMGSVMRDYEAALRVARCGAERAKTLSWHRAGERLAEILSAIDPK